ncbi:MAG TPA: hypothetical protein VMF61_08685 [Candidatus Acidoferrales bacterium]|nr:hypothetical protein [Candidatus Acidoferrales bacterium]
MTKLRERLPLPAYEKPWKYLNRAICHISSDQGPDVVRLKLPLLGAEGPALEKDVTLAYQASPGDAEDSPWALNWKPVGGGPYPHFRGHLSIEGTDGQSAPALVLDGAYVPPLGAAGAAFDAVVGARIASATAREFLRSIAGKMERERARDES